MSIFFRRGTEEQRAGTSIAGWGRGDDVMFGSDMSAALAVVPVFAAVRLLSDRISTLPMQGYRHTADGGHERRPLAPVFPVHGRIRWIQQALISLNLNRLPILLQIPEPNNVIFPRGGEPLAVATDG